MGTEYNVLFAPKVGQIALSVDDIQVRTISNEEIDILIGMLKELKSEQVVAPVKPLLNIEDNFAMRLYKKMFSELNIWEQRYVQNTIYTAL